MRQPCTEAYPAIDTDMPDDTAMAEHRRRSWKSGLSREEIMRKQELVFAAVGQRKSVPEIVAIFPGMSYRTVSRYRQAYFKLYPEAAAQHHNSSRQSCKSRSQHAEPAQPSTAPIALIPSPRVSETSGRSLSAVMSPSHPLPAIHCLPQPPIMYYPPTAFDPRTEAAALMCPAPPSQMFALAPSGFMMPSSRVPCPSMAYAPSLIADPGASVMCRPPMVASSSAALARHPASAQLLMIDPATMQPVGREHAVPAAVPYAQVMQRAGHKLAPPLAAEGVVSRPAHYASVPPGYPIMVMSSQSVPPTSPPVSRTTLTCQATTTASSRLPRSPSTSAATSSVSRPSPLKQCKQQGIDSQKVPPINGVSPPRSSELSPGSSSSAFRRRASTLPSEAVFQQGAGVRAY